MRLLHETNLDGGGRDRGEEEDVRRGRSGGGMGWGKEARDLADLKLTLTVSCNSDNEGMTTSMTLGLNKSLLQLSSEQFSPLNDVSYVDSGISEKRN